VKPLEKGAIVFRARVDNRDKYLSDASALGPPEVAKNSNRMSPAGIVMFYGAFDARTAVEETFHPDEVGTANKVVTVAQWRCRRDLLILDLTELPPMPSYFGDPELHHGIAFLHAFVQDFEKPVARDDMEHVEYVPTQIVTEYFRHRFQPEGDDSLDGILYKSSKTQGRNCVLFFDRTACGVSDGPTPRETMLQLVEGTIVRMEQLPC